MRVTGLGKLILLILVVGAAFGGWRFWQNMSKNGGSGSGSGSSSGGSSLFGKNNG